MDERCPSISFNYRLTAKMQQIYRNCLFLFQRKHSYSPFGMPMLMNE